MEHNDIRHKLSEYIDGSVTAHEKSAIDAHLKTCLQCSNALSELRKTIEHIKTVEEIEPPAWMTQKIMAMVRAETEEKKGFFQRFFFPLHVKLPIQAVAVLFLAVTAYTINQNIQRTPELSETPLQGSATRKEAPPIGTEQDKPGKADAPARRSKKVQQSPEYKALDMKLEYEKPALPVLEDRAAAPAPAPAKPAEYLMPLKKEATSDKLTAIPQASGPSIMADQAAPTAGASVHAKRKSTTLTPSARIMAEKGIKDIDLQKYIGRRESELSSFNEISTDKSDLGASMIGEDHVLLTRKIHGTIVILFAKYIPQKSPNKVRDALITDAILYPATGENNNLITWLCALRGKADQELIAMVDTTRNMKKLPAIKAWRLNRKNGKIEPIDPFNISCVNESYGN